MEQVEDSQQEVPAAALPTPSEPPSSTPTPSVEAPRLSSTPAVEAARPSFIYALGQVEPRFPSPAVEKEFAQVTGRGETAGLTDGEALQKVLSERTNRYLARQLCWVFNVQGLETYILVPRDPSDLELLVGAVRPRPQQTALDLAIGVQGPLAPAEMCDGLVVPIVVLDHIYSFDRDTLVGAIPPPEGTLKKDERRFREMAGELFDRIGQMTDNAGASDEHRALNYLAVRYPAIYSRAVEAHNANSSLTAVEVRPSPLSGVRRIVDVIFSFTDRSTDVTDKSLVSVDVTEEFPFLITKLSPYFDR